MRQVINSELLAIPEWNNFVKSPIQNNDFSLGRSVNLSEIYKNLLENLLLYDQILVLTHSFEEVHTLRTLLSGHILTTLLHDNVIKFIQIPYTWGYIQKQKQESGIFKSFGIVQISLAEQNQIGLEQGFVSNKLGGWSSEDLEKAITYTLTKFHDFNEGKVGKFARLVAKNTDRLGSNEFAYFIRKKSEDDMGSTMIRQYLDISDDVDIYNIPDKSPDIRKIFRIVNSNQLMAVVQCYPEADLYAEKYYTESLKYGLISEIKKEQFIKKVDDLFNVVQIPRPRDLGIQGGLMIEDIIRIRKTKEAEEFRDWAHKNIFSQNDLICGYESLMKKKIPVIARYAAAITPTIASKFIENITKTPVPPMVDLGMGIISEFVSPSLYDRYLIKNPPKIFFNKIEEITKKRNKLLDM